MATYIQIATATVGAGGSASMDFTSIPSTYTDLVFKLSVRQTNASAFSTVQFTVNGGTGTYSNGKNIEGDGSTVTSSSTPARYVGYFNAATSTASTFANVEMYCPNYAGTANKSFSIDYASENNATLSYAGMVASLWTVTSAITSLSFVPFTGNFAQYSTATLYGISKS
jgi:hypothetical protein